MPLPDVLLAITLATGTSMLPAPAMEPSGLDVIADRIEHAAPRIVRCDTPGATKPLIHVRQVHYEEPGASNGTSALTTEQLAQRRAGCAVVNAVQREIAELLPSLLRHAGTSNVMLENIMVPAATESVAKEYNRILNTLEAHKYITPFVPDEKNMTYAQIGFELFSRYSRHHSDWQEYAYIPGAALLLALDETIQIIPAETTESVARGHTAVRREKTQGNPAPEFIPEVTDDREDVALQVAAASQDNVAVVVYGGGHAFGGPLSCGDRYDAQNRRSEKDNIAAWNAQHSQQFSLMEITVPTYDQFFGIGTSALPKCECSEQHRPAQNRP